MFTLVSRMLALVALFGLLLAAPAIADAKTHKRPPTDAEAAQSTICGAFGGYTTTDTSPIEVDHGGSKGPKVKSRTECNGGLLGGMYCTNYETFSNCVMTSTNPASNDPVLEQAPEVDLPAEQIDVLAEETVEVLEPTATATEPSPDATTATPPIEDVVPDATLVPVTPEPVVDGAPPIDQPLQELPELEPIEVVEP